MKEVRISVDVSDVNSAIEKMRQLNEEIERAKTAATELAQLLKKLRIEDKPHSVFTTVKIDEDFACGSSNAAR